MIEETKSDSLLSLLNKAGYKDFGIFTNAQNIKVPKFSSNKSSKLSKKEIKQLLLEVDESSLDPSHPFYKKKIVITGKIGEGMNRSQWQEAIINVGGYPEETVNKTTNILVEGVQTANNLKNGESKKYRIAHELFEKNFPIEFLDGEDFIRLL
ncbi:BRCT domain-containing protein [Hutsoniella sourekii]